MFFNVYPPDFQRYLGKKEKELSMRKIVNKTLHFILKRKQRKRANINQQVTEYKGKLETHKESLQYMS